MMSWQFNDAFDQNWFRCKNQIMSLQLFVLIGF